MSATQDFATLKAQLEERIASLAREKDAVQKEVESLTQKVALKELERQARSLEGELGGLKGKKNSLEQKLASYSAPPVQSAPLAPKPLVRTVAP
jgi:chromosome segregation ATPase